MCVNMGIYVIGVVKAATKRFPMKPLRAVELRQRGDRHGLVRKKADGKVQYMAFVCVVRDKRYHIV